MALLNAPLPGSSRLLAIHPAQLPQKDDLCGPFWGLLALRALGADAEARLDQDAVALAAGSVVSAPPRDDSLPPGEQGRDDYRLALPEAPAGAPVGTSPCGLARAIEQLSEDALNVQPASAPSVAGLRSLLEALTEAPRPLVLIANLHTGLLWDPAASPAQLDAYLESGEVDAGPEARWRVGHFVALTGLVRGRSGTLVVVADSYRSRGVDGVQLQPLERLAAAIAREGMNPGGMLLVVAADQRDAARQVVVDAGLEPELWDNGSPDASGPH